MTTAYLYISIYCFFWFQPVEFSFAVIDILDLLLILFTMTQASHVNFVVGSHAWVEDPELAWIDGEVLEVNNQEIKVELSSGKIVGSIYHSFNMRDSYIITDFYFLCIIKETMSSLFTEKWPS